MKKLTITFAIAVLGLTAGFANTTTSAENTNCAIENSINRELSSFCKLIMQGNTEMVKELLKLGENVNQKSLGKTPAMYAARYNKPEIMKLLIAHGADLSIKSSEDRLTAREYAERSNATDVLKVIDAMEK